MKTRRGQFNRNHRMNPKRRKRFNKDNVNKLPYSKRRMPTDNVGWDIPSMLWLL